MKKIILENCKIKSSKVNSLVPRVFSLAQGSGTPAERAWERGCKVNYNGYTTQSNQQPQLAKAGINIQQARFFMEL